jgi:hypothetical protein
MSYNIDNLEADYRGLRESTGAGLEAIDLIAPVRNFFDGVKKFFGDKIYGSNQDLIYADFKPVAKAVKTHNYTDFMDLQVYQPARLNIPYKEWIANLQTARAFCSLVDGEHVAKLQSWLAQVAGGKGSIAYAPTVDKQVMGKVESILGKGLGGKDVTNASFAARFSNMTEFITSYDDFNKLVDALKRGQVRDFTAAVRRVAELADTVYAQIESGDITVNKSDVDLLAKVMLDTARAVDLYSVCITLFIATGTALTNTAQKLGDEVK